eukprot:1646898-Rhodomonas_salina.1
MASRTVSLESLDCGTTHAIISKQQTFHCCARLHMTHLTPPYSTQPPPLNQHSDKISRGEVQEAVQQPSLLGSALTILD